MKEVQLPIQRILMASDLHFKEVYGYAEEFEDRRIKERQAIEDMIVKAAEGCDTVLLNGDILNSRVNSPNTLAHFTAFLERFGDKRVIIVGGNHSKAADGTSALDYLTEVKEKPWLFAIKETLRIHTDYGDVVCVPYFYQKERGAENVEDLTAKIMEDIGKGNCAIFIHHAISSTLLTHGGTTDMMKGEPVLAAKDLGKRAVRTFGGHIHKPGDYGNVHVIGNLMCEEIGDADIKRVIQYDLASDKVTSICLPGRRLAKLVDPTKAQLQKAKQQYDLVKIVTSKALSKEDLEGLAEVVKILEKPKEARKKDGQELTDFSPGNLLMIYAKERNVSADSLLRAWKEVGGA